MASIHSLTPDLLAEILAKLGSNDFKSLFEAKRSMRMFNVASEFDIVYKKVELTKFPVNIRVVARQEVAAFMERCVACGNPDALFRQGVVDFFMYGAYREGLVDLGAAAREGHREAQYLLGVIVILVADDGTEKGIKMLSGMKEADGTVPGLTEIRANVRAILSQIWINGPIKSVELRTCCRTKHQHNWRNNGFEYMEREIHCDACHCDREVEYVYGLFTRGWN